MVFFRTWKPLLGVHEKQVRHYIQVCKKEQLFKKGPKSKWSLEDIVVIWCAVYHAQMPLDTVRV